MGKYLKPLVSVFGIALLLSAIGSGSSHAGDGPPPGTRDINVRVIAICASPVGGEPHEGDAFKCLCFGGPLNGYNATMSPDGIHCPRRTIGPFCFVTEDFMPLYWKETVRNQSGPTTVRITPPNTTGKVEVEVECPPGKMVLSCQGAVTVGDTNEPAANVVGYGFPKPDGLACRYVAIPDPNPDPCAELAKVAECPCDYHSVPQTAECWGNCTGCNGDVVFTPCDNPGCVPPLDDGSNSDTCSLVNGPINRGLFTAQTETLTLCQIELDNSSCAEDILLDQISQDQFSTCLCRQAQYTNELAQAGIEITDTGPPFSCEPPAD
jgi:hypothetical protein